MVVNGVLYSDDAAIHFFKEEHFFMHRVAAKSGAKKKQPQANYPQTDKKSYRRAGCTSGRKQ